VLVNELATVIRIDADDGKPENALEVLKGFEDPFRGLVSRRPIRRPPVEMSATVNVKQNWPALLPPSWPTRSISTILGTASSHSAQVRIGICDFNNVPGLVCDRPLASSWPARGRVSGRLWPHSFASTIGITDESDQARYPATALALRQAVSGRAVSPPEHVTPPNTSPTLAANPAHTLVSDPTWV
jgi:hypothetical protein